MYLQMAKKLTEDAVRDKARDILGFKDKDGVRSGVGQITTFNQLGFPGVSDKPDGWYLPDNHADTAIVLETKASYIALGDKQVDEVLKNVKIVQEQYSNVVGILYNGDDTKVFKGEIEFQGNGSNILQNLEYYTALFNKEHIDKEYIYELTAKINNCLHFEFGIKNLYHRMIFTACALVAKRFDALMVKGMDYSEFHNAILNCLNKELMRDKRQNQKLSLLSDVFSEIRMNLNVDSEDAKEQQRVKDLALFIVPLIKTISTKYNYVDKWKQEVMVADEIMLPCTDDGEPDCDYMSSYMKKILEESKTYIEKLNQVKNNKELINVTQWQRFHLYDDELFDIDMGTKMDKAKMTELNPKVNFVGRANNNNGITARIDKVEGVEPYEAGNMTLSLGGEYLGSCFIQPDVFYTSQNVVVLIPKWKMSFGIKQFISAMIFKESRLYYKAFVDELNRHIKTDFSFLLPVKDDGKPDWSYMEQYMRNMMNVSEKVIENLGMLGL